MPDILWIFVFQRLFNIKLKTPFPQHKIRVRRWMWRRVVVHVEYSVSCVHNFAANFLALFPIVKLSDFVLLNYLATTFFNLATVFSLKVAKWRLGIFCSSISSPDWYRHQNFVSLSLVPSFPNVLKIWTYRRHSAKKKVIIRIFLRGVQKSLKSILWSRWKRKRSNKESEYQLSCNVDLVSLSLLKW